MLPVLAEGLIIHINSEKFFYWFVFLAKCEMNWINPEAYYFMAQET